MQVQYLTFIIAKDGLIDLDQLPQIAKPVRVSLHQVSNNAKSGESRSDPIPSADPAEKTVLVEALKKTNGNQSQAAPILGINRVTVWYRMRKYGIDLKKVLTT